MRIAILTPGKLPVPAINGGAVEVLTEYIVEGFNSKTKYSVDVYTIHDDNINFNKYNNIKFNVISYKKVVFFLCRCLNFICKFLKRKKIVLFPYDLKAALKLRKKKYDYIIVQNNIFLYNTVYYFYPKKNSTKFIYHIHSLIQDSRSIEGYRTIAKTAHKVIAVSEFLKQTCLKIENSMNLEVLLNCVDLARFNPNSLSGKCINIPLTKKFKFLFTGRLVEDKGVLELICAFKRLNNEFHDSELIIVGSKVFGVNAKERYLKKIEKEAQCKDIYFTGFIAPENLPSILSKIDCVVIPSKWEEPFGVVALEAMAMIKPIIATNAGGLIEALNKDCAIIIQKEEDLVKELYKAMKEIYLNDALRKNLENGAFERIHNIDEFNKEYYFNSFLKKADIQEVK